MPTGRYLHLDPYDGAPVAVEEFSCAAGPVGWRYTAVLREPEPGRDLDGPGGGGDPGEAAVRAGQATGRVDVTLDAGGRQVRVEVLGGGWRLRGGVAGGETVWLRSAATGGGEPLEASAAALGLAGRSPAFLIATARRLRLSPGARARVRLVAVTEPALGTRLVDEAWQLVTLTEYQTQTGQLPVERYDIVDLATGEVRTVHLAGDVVVAAPALELTALYSPPTW